MSLGGTGTGGTASPPFGSGTKPEHLEDDVEYAVVYPNPIIQNCGLVERSIRFVSHYAPYNPLQANDRQDLFGINSKSLPPIRFKVQVVVKNNTDSPLYEYVERCKAAFQLSGAETPKITTTDYCLNDEVVNEYQPHESRTQYYSFNLPNIFQNWTVSYRTQYAGQFDGSSFDEDNLAQRTQCEPLTTKLTLSTDVSAMDVYENNSFYKLTNQGK